MYRRPCAVSSMVVQSGLKCGYALADPTNGGFDGMKAARGGMNDPRDRRERVPTSGAQRII